MLLIFIGVTLLRWIDEVSESQRYQAQPSLRGAFNLSVEDHRFKTWLLLGTFRANPDLDRSSRVKHFQQSCNSWHELSVQGPVVRRILFYDMSSSKTGTLTELLVEPGGLQPAVWDESLVQVRRHIEGSGFPPARGVHKRWPARWILLPQAMALFRPVVSHVPSYRRRLDWPAVTGYLILMLDLA